MGKILILCFLAVGFGQFESQGTKMYEGEGRLVTLKLVPGEKSAKLFLAGKKAADVLPKPKLVSIEAFVRGKTESLSFKPDGESYVISPAPPKASRLKIRMQVGTKEDSAELQLSQP